MDIFDWNVFVEFGFKQCEQGTNLESALAKAKTIIKEDTTISNRELWFDIMDTPQYKQVSCKNCRQTLFNINAIVFNELRILFPEQVPAFKSVIGQIAALHRCREAQR